MSTQRTIEASAVTGVKGYEIPFSIPGAPLGAVAMRALLENCPAVIADLNTEQPSLPFNDGVEYGFGASSIYALHQISSSHKRSFEVRAPGMDISWQDEFGNNYNALSIKGNNFSEPHIMQHPTASEGYIAYGLQESSIIERVLRASQLMRSRGIATENILGVAEPKLYPWPSIDSVTDASEFMTLKAYKARLVKEYWENLDDSTRTFEHWAELTQKFNSMTFFITLRATDTPYRLNDLNSKQARAEVFEQVNQHLHESERPYDEAGFGDVMRYIRNRVAPATARYLARLHVDSAHGFANALNLTAYGGIVDLDSVHGPSIGLDDEPITDEERANDIIEVLYAIASYGIYIPGVDAQALLLDFVDDYFDEVFRLDGSEDTTSESTTLRVIQLTEALLEQADESEYYGWERVAKALETRFGNGYIDQIKPNDYDELQATVLDAIHTITADRGLMGTLQACFVSEIPIYADLLISDYINEISDADRDGNGLYNDLLPIFIRQFQHRNELSDTESEIVTNIEVLLQAKLVKHLMHKTDLAKYGITPKTVDITKFVWGALVSKNPKEFKNLVTTIVTGLLHENSEQLSKAVQFDRPQQFIDSRETMLCTPPINAGRLWRISSDINLESLTAAAREQGIVYTWEDMDESDDSDEIKITTTKGAVLLEVLSDEFIVGHAVAKSEPYSTLVLNFDDKPSYVATLEQHHDGSQGIHIVLSERAKRPTGSQLQSLLERAGVKVTRTPNALTLF